MPIEMLTMMTGKPKHKKKEVSATQEVIRPILRRFRISILQQFTISEI